MSSVHSPPVHQLFVKLPSSGRLIVVSVSPFTSVAELTAIVRRRALEVSSDSGEADVPFVLTTRTGKWLDRGYLVLADVGLADQQQLEMRRGCLRAHAPEGLSDLELLVSAAGDSELGCSVRVARSTPVGALKDSAVGL